MTFTILAREHVMKKTRFTQEQIAFAIKKSELGTKVEEIGRKMGIRDATFYKWRQQYAALGLSAPTTPWSRASMADWARRT